jgi:hypothetical protein
MDPGAVAIGFSGCEVFFRRMPAIAKHKPIQVPKLTSQVAITHASLSGMTRACDIEKKSTASLPQLAG